MEPQRFRASRAVRASISADGLVLLDVQGGLVLASNPAGARIWQQIEEGRTPGDIASALVDEYHIDLERAERDVRAFLDALTARGLVTSERAC